jgi:hypothetical protein
VVGGLLKMGDSIKLRALCFNGKLWGGITRLEDEETVDVVLTGVATVVTTTEEAIFLNFLWV